MQQWEGLSPDLHGRFYDPRRPEFGPPHAASTGAYLEGLADAAALARALGDQRRASGYERAVHRGLRSLRQLQFRDERDAFYVSRKKRVLGALRTEAYDNAVRVDSAAHALAAAIKVLRPMEFGGRRPEPYDAELTPPAARPWKSLRALARRRISAGASKLGVASPHRAATVAKNGRPDSGRPRWPKHGISDTPRAGGILSFPQWAVRCASRTNWTKPGTAPTRSRFRIPDHLIGGPELLFLLQTGVDRPGAAAQLNRPELSSSARSRICPGWKSNHCAKAR